MTFTPECVNVKKLLNKGIFNIPDYQRPYQWGDEQLDKLWDDIFSEYSNDQNSDYFLGSIVMSKTKNANTTLQIIDGQQRLTSLTILCNVILKRHSDCLVYNDDDDITKEDIENCLFSRVNDQKTRIRYDGQDKFMTDYRNVVILKNEWKKKSKYELSLDMNDPKVNYENSAAFFEEKLEELKENKYSFIKYLFTKVNVITIECDSENSAIKLFQVINDRGLDLTNADLIKARVYSDLDETQKKQFKINWDLLINNLKSIDVSIDDYLTALAYYYTEEKPLEDLTTTYDKKIISKLEDKDRLIDMFKNSADDLVSAFNSNNKYINSIRNLMTITWKIYGYALILCIWSKYKNNEFMLNSLLNKTRRFLYLSYMADYSISSIQQTCFNVIKNINAGESIEKIDELFEKLITRKSIIERAETLSLNILSYGFKELKPLMLSLEYEVGHPYILLSDELEADHILPEEWKAAPNNEWGNILPEKDTANSIINTLGNMAILEGYKNNKQKNRGFAIKKKFYLGQDENGNRIDKVTTFQYSMDVANNNTEWNCEKIKNRNTILINKIKEMLNII